ncbi:MAG: hybrid sensor histidine kinase/response regulator [Solirubrobacteraceae bacterium]
MAIAATVGLADRNRRLGRANGSLTERNRRLQETLDARTRFVSHLSHELRTPLHALLGHAQLLQDGDGEGGSGSDAGGALSAPVREQLAAIDSSGRHMLSLVEQLRDLAGIDAGRPRLSPRAIDASAVARECLRSVTAQAAARGVQLALEASAEPVALTLDPVRLRQVMLNYLTNAIRFTQAGGLVTLSLGRAEDRLELAVSDNGAGIAPRDQARVFGEFVFLGERERHGSGLGLAIVKRIVEAQGGEVGVSSTPGFGSTFYARLPWRPMVLVVDDHQLGRRLVARSLERARIDVLEAGSLSEAELVLERCAPAAIVLDLRLPDGDGLELATRLRADPRTAECAIVACSAADADEERARARRAGCDAYVAKPIDPRRLRELVGSLLYGRAAAARGPLPSK